MSLAMLGGSFWGLFLVHILDVWDPLSSTGLECQQSLYRFRCRWSLSPHPRNKGAREKKKLVRQGRAGYLASDQCSHRVLCSEGPHAVYYSAIAILAF